MVVCWAGAIVAIAIPFLLVSATHPGKKAKDQGGETDRIPDRYHLTVIPEPKIALELEETQ